MYFVYIIRSLTHPNQIYVGYTSDLKKRLARHNCGSTHHTNKYNTIQNNYASNFAQEREQSCLIEPVIPVNAFQARVTAFMMSV